MLKSFDFFRKIQTQQQLTSTTGGCFTILAFVAAGILIFLSIQDYYHQTYYTFLAVKNDEAEYLPMRIDILFDKMPCQAIQIQFNDQLQYVENNLQQKLTMSNVKDNNQEQLYERNKNNRQQQRQNLQNALRNKYKCRVAGILNVPKVVLFLKQTPGSIIISPLGNNGLIESVDHKLAFDARMSYKLNVLQFGLGNNTFDFPIAHKSPVVQQYIRDLQGTVNTRQFIQDFSNVNQKVNFYNHLKIIPVVFDENSSLVQTGEKYRYSLRAGQARAYQPFQQLFFYTEIQPINIVYKRQNPSLYNLVVNILAIVGGTVATIGVVNSISHFLFNIK